MLPVISDNEWKRFCTRHELPLGQAVFAIGTCYYGIGLRTRPGTLILTRSELIHYSYSWQDTFYAMFEPSVPIIISLPEITRVIQRHFGFWRRAYLANPGACFEIVTCTGESHHLLFQHAGDEFTAALAEVGIVKS